MPALSNVVSNLDPIKSLVLELCSLIKDFNNALKLLQYQITP